MRLRFLDRFLDPGRRRRARQAAEAFTDPASQAAAERVLFFIERVAGVRPDQVDLDADVGAVVAGAKPTDRFWDYLELSIAGDQPRRLHALENLRTGSVRHLIHHLSICRVCRP